MEAAGNPTFHTLRRFVSRARQAGVDVYFVAFRPRPGPAGPGSYPIDPEALRTIADAGMLHLDLRGIDELEPDMYSDPVHLNALGSPIYTTKLAEEISGAWRRQGRSGPAVLQDTTTVGRPLAVNELVKRSEPSNNGRLR